MKSDFITYLRLNEAVKDKVFNIDIDNVEYTVDRRGHLLQKRAGDNETFSIFGAIMNSSEPEESLYKAATQRLKINL